jgi:PAS domain S-box-containing protein
MNEIELDALGSADALRFARCCDGISQYAVLLVDAEHRIRSWNDGARNLFAYHAEELREQPLARLFTASDVSGEVITKLLDEAALHRAATRELWCVRSGGKRFWGSCHVACTQIEPAGRPGFLVIIRDGSELQHVRESLSQIQATMQAFYDHTPLLMGITELTEDDDILHIYDNVATCNFFRVEPGSTANRLARAELGAEPHAMRIWIDSYLRSEREQGPVKLEHEFRQQGEVRWLSANVFPLGVGPTGRKRFCYVAEDVTEQRRAERIAREQTVVLQEQAHLLSLTPVVISDMESRVVMWSDGAREMYGFTREEAEGRVLHELLATEAGQPIEAIHAQLRAVGTWRGELHHCCKDGRRIVVTSRWALHRSASNAPAKILQVDADITELRRAEQALSESEVRLRMALTAGKMGVWDWNVVTGEVQWSNGLEAIHGLEPGTFGGNLEAFQRVVYPDDLPLVFASIDQHLNAGEDFDVEFRNVHADGSVHWMASKGKSLLENGVPKRMIGIAMDISDRKRTEQNTRFLADASTALAALVDEQETLQRLAHLAVPYFADWCAVEMLDRDGQIQHVAAAHAGTPKLGLLTEKYRDPGRREEAYAGIRRILETGRAEIIADFFDPDAAGRSCNPELFRKMQAFGVRAMIGVPLMVREKILGVVTFMRMLTGRQYNAEDLMVAQDLATRAAIAIENARLYQEVREADQRKDQFLATLAHELRNPLTPIRTGLELLRHTHGGEQEQPVREMMQRQVTHLVRLVDDLMDVSRINRGKIELRKERVTLEAVINTAIEACRPLIEGMRHSLTVAHSAAPVLLDADPIRLAQVFANLLNNASKYTDAGGQITLEVSLHDSQVLVTVRDSGIGIPPDQLQSIFDLFAQVDRALEKAQGGLGIGLSLVKALVGLHGGSVEARSAGIGQGSEFLVRLPVHIDTEPVSGGGERDTAPSKPLKILVADDNHDAAGALAWMLKLMGHDTRVAHDGQESLHLAAEFKPDVAILDIGMPRLNGYAVAKALNAHPPAGKRPFLIAHTGWGEEGTRALTQEAGFDCHLVKPLDPAVLLKLLAEIQ